VHPDVVTAADAGNRGEIVDGAGVGRPAGGDDGDGPYIVGAIAFDRRFERADLHPVVGVGRIVRMEALPNPRSSIAFRAQLCASVDM